MSDDCRISKEECEKLLNLLLPFADEQLKKNKAFLPFGAVIAADKSIIPTS